MDGFTPDAVTALRAPVSPGATELPVMEGGGFAERPGTVVLGDPAGGVWEEAEYGGVAEDAEGEPVLAGVTGVDGVEPVDGVASDWPAGTPVLLKPWTVVERVDFFVPPTPEQARAGRIVQFSTPGYRDYVGVAGWDEEDEPTWLLVGTAADAGSLEMRQVGSFGTAGSGNGQFNGPQGVAVSPLTGDIYVADTLNNRVQRFSAAGAYLGQWARAWAVGVAVSPTSGDVYVTSTTGNGVYRHSAAGTLLGSIAAAGSGNGQFATPSGVSVSPDGTKVYVADGGNSRVQVLTSALAYSSQFGSAGTGDGQFSNLVGVAVAPDGTVYTSDFGGNRVQRFSSAGAFLLAFGAPGGMPGQFFGPFGVTVGPDGAIWVADISNDRVQVFDAAGAFLGEFGSPGSGAGQFGSPRFVALSADGTTAYVTDSQHDRVTLWKDAAAGVFPVITTRTNAGSVANGASGAVSATCLAGEVVVGGGGRFNSSQATLYESYPVSATAWQAGGRNPTAGSLTLTVYAQCLQVPLS